MCVNSGLYVYFMVGTQTQCTSALLFLQQAEGQRLKADDTVEMHSVVKEGFFIPLMKTKAASLKERDNQTSCRVKTTEAEVGSIVLVSV